MIAISLHKNRQMKFLSACVTSLLTLLLYGQCAFALQTTHTRPNVLWLSTEDIGPQLACYGDTTAKTPNLDALAAQGLTMSLGRTTLFAPRPEPRSFLACTREL